MFNFSNVNPPPLQVHNTTDLPRPTVRRVWDVPPSPLPNNASWEYMSYLQTYEQPDTGTKAQWICESFDPMRGCEFFHFFFEWCLCIHLLADNDDGIFFPYQMLILLMCGFRLFGSMCSSVSVAWFADADFNLVRFLIFQDDT